MGSEGHKWKRSEDIHTIDFGTFMMQKSNLGIDCIVAIAKSLIYQSPTNTKSKA